jgi:polysaccharide export outer membrane protein
MNSALDFVRLLFCLLAATATAFLTGCQTPPSRYADGPPATNAPPGGTPVSVPPDLASGGKINPNSIDILRPGYKVTITFSGINPPPPKHEEKIREDGCITPPLLGPVLAAGKTIGTLQEELQALYVPDYYRMLTVTVTTEDRFFFVGGEVKSEGPRPYLPGMTVLKAIQHAGGFTEFANRKKVWITRADGRQEQINCSKATKNPKYDKLIFPDDRVDVLRKWY